MTSEKEDYTIQIRDKLRKEDIKLWLSPYYDLSVGASEPEILQLSEVFSKALNIPLDVCKEILQELQTQALENLKLNMKYRESGVATLKIKVANLSETSKKLVKEVMLSARGKDLKELICQDISIPIDRLKLICGGKVLADYDSLSSQGVKNSQQILAVVLNETAAQRERDEYNVKAVEAVKTDTQLLASDSRYMKLEDQFGNPVRIPERERKALIVALALHEKGRAALKKEDYSTALVYFLEADQEYKKCNSALLKGVDNYALLDLDIAWCYLCLQSFTHLPEAQERLARCDQQFQQTYGTNFERLLKIKGSSGNEACFLTRLHLLQAIVLYHQNKRAESLEILKRVETEINSLKVDEDKIISLLEIGYSTTEARVGLRCSGGDVDAAANYINDNRKKRQEGRQKALADEVFEKEKRKLGLCDDGKQYVDPNFLKLLVNMGFNKEVARCALKSCNNIISDSIQYIQDNPCPGPSSSKSTEFLDLINDLIPQLIEAGFDPRMAKMALVKHHGDLYTAAEELLANDGIVVGDLSQFDISQESIEKIQEKLKNQDKEKNEALKRLQDDLSTEDDHHLDINLVQEELFLKEYLSLLQK